MKALLCRQRVCAYLSESMKEGTNAVAVALLHNIHEDRACFHPLSTSASYGSTYVRRILSRSLQLPGIAFFGAVYIQPGLFAIRKSSRPRVGLNCCREFFFSRVKTP